MKKVAILQSNYIPWKGYFDLINMADEFVWYDDMQYTKNDWRNRNLIKTPNGPQWLSIPVEISGKHFQKINEMQVSERYSGWHLKHWETIRHNYSKAPFFKEYKPLFEELYLSCSEKNLSKINQGFMKAICEALNIYTTFHDSRSFSLAEDRTQRLVDICLELKASHYISGPAAKAYLDESVFERNNIKVEWMDYSGYREYPQLYPPFAHGVSVIDLIFNCGPEAKKYMNSF